MTTEPTINATAARCAVLVEINGKLHQVHLEPETEFQVLCFVLSVVGEPVKIYPVLETLSLNPR